MPSKCVGDMRTTPSTEVKLNWLDKVHPILEWKVLYQPADNPYGKSLSDKALMEYASDDRLLRKRLQLRAQLDGEEVLRVTDLERITILSSHPSVGALRKHDYVAYFKQHKFERWIRSEMERIQQEYREDLERRKAAKSGKQRAQII